MPTIRLADLSKEPTLVELGEEQVYKVRPITRSVQKHLERAQEALRATEGDEDTDRQVIALVGAIDVLLEPQDGAPAAKTVLSRAWKADQLSAEQLGALFDHLNEGSAPPT